MSASQDKSQKIAFVYSNLYEIYKKGKTAAQEAPEASDAGDGEAAPRERSSREMSHEALALIDDSLSAPLVIRSGRVLKSQDARLEAPEGVQVKAYAPVELLGKRVPRPEILKSVAPEPTQNPALGQLKENLKTLNDLHSRLKFLLKELEDLVK